MKIDSHFQEGYSRDSFLNKLSLQMRNEVIHKRIMLPN
jgi:hypothetical protein